MDVSHPILANNLRALGHADPRAAAWLARAAVESGTAPPSDAIDTPRGLGADHAAIVQGIGAGGDATALLESSAATVFVVESSPAVCLAAFRRFDFSAELAAGRLRILAVAPASPAAQEVSLRECLGELLAELHRPGRRLRFVQRGAVPDAFFAALRAGAEEASRAVASLVAARAPGAAFDVTVVGPSCAIFDDLAQCFAGIGLRVQSMRVPDRPGVWDAGQWHAARANLLRQPARLVVARNRVLLEAPQPGDYPQAEALIPGHVAMWWWDVPNVATNIELRHPRGGAQSFAFARDILPLLPPGAEWLPAGARTAAVEAGTQPESERDIAVSFVGQSRIGLLEAILGQLGGILDGLDAGAPALARDLSGRSGYQALYRYLESHRGDIGDAIATLRPAFPAHAYFLRYLLDMAVTAAFRIAAVERLLKEGVDLALYGDPEWLKVPGVTETNFRGVCPHGELPALYRRSRVNLNLNFMQVSSTVNPKVLDICASGSVALTDPRPELGELFPDPAARPFVFDSLEDLPEQVSALSGAELEAHRRAVGEHVRGHHTLQHRARRLAEHFGLSPR